MARSRRKRTSLDIGRCGLHLDTPRAALDAVRHLALDKAQHSLRRVGRIRDGEGDGVIGSSGHIPHAVRPIVRPAVQSVGTIV